MNGMNSFVRALLTNHCPFPDALTCSIFFIISKKKTPIFTIRELLLMKSPLKNSGVCIFKGLRVPRTARTVIQILTTIKVLYHVPTSYRVHPSNPFLLFNALSRDTSIKNPSHQYYKSILSTNPKEINSMATQGPFFVYKRIFEGEQANGRCSLTLVSSNTTLAGANRRAERNLHALAKKNGHRNHNSEWASKIHAGNHGGAYYGSTLLGGFETCFTVEPIPIPSHVRNHDIRDDIETLFDYSELSPEDMNETDDEYQEGMDIDSNSEQPYTNDALQTPLPSIPPLERNAVPCFSFTANNNRPEQPSGFPEYANFSEHQQLFAKFDPMMVDQTNLMQLAQNFTRAASGKDRLTHVRKRSSDFEQPRKRQRSSTNTRTMIETAA